MTVLRNVTATLLVLCLFQLALADSVQAATTAIPASVREQVNEFGVGAKVKLKLAGGEKVSGTIGAIDNDSFVLSSRHGDQTQEIAYDQVAQLKLANRNYRASGTPDPVQARRLVLSLGVGKHAVVKTTGGEEYHGNIQAIDADHFTILPDNQMSSVEIPYSNVRYVEKNISLGTTIFVVVVVVLAVAVASYLGVR